MSIRTGKVCASVFHQIVGFSISHSSSVSGADIFILDFTLFIRKEFLLCPNFAVCVLSFQYSNDFNVLGFKYCSNIFYVNLKFCFVVFGIFFLVEKPFEQWITFAIIKYTK